MTRTRKLPKEEIMKTYIGTKVVRAEPALERVYEGEPARDGYKVVYEDGYTSWSPKDVFERCYREVTSDESKLVVDSLDYVDWPSEHG